MDPPPRSSSSAPPLLRVSLPPGPTTRPLLPVALPSILLLSSGAQPPPLSLLLLFPPKHHLHQQPRPVVIRRQKGRQPNLARGDETRPIWRRCDTCALVQSGDLIIFSSRPAQGGPASGQIRCDNSTTALRSSSRPRPSGVSPLRPLYPRQVYQHACRQARPKPRDMFEL